VVTVLVHVISYYFIFVCVCVCVCCAYALVGDISRILIHGYMC
jgi:hypothetical protein